MTIATKPPPKEADIVVHVAFAARRHLFPVTPNVLKIFFLDFFSTLAIKLLILSDKTYLPALNANHPHHIMKRPTSALVGQPIGGAPSMFHLPNLGPSIQEAAKALAPPTR